MLNKTVAEYLDSAASRSPAPGGGSAAALAGALGASMASMAANFTVGKKGYEKVQDEAGAILAESETCRRKLSELAEEDIKAYEKVSRAYALPRSTPQEKSVRKQKIAETTREALMVPLEAAAYCLRLIRTLDRLADICNKNLVSDVGVAAHLALAALKSARLNVEINLACLDDEAFAEEKRRIVSEAVSDSERIVSRAVSRVKNILGA